MMVVFCVQVDLQHDLSMCSDDGTSVLNERYCSHFVFISLFHGNIFFLGLTQIYQ